MIFRPAVTYQHFKYEEEQGHAEEIHIKFIVLLKHYRVIFLIIHPGDFIHNRIKTELAVSGPGVMTCYYKDEKATDEVLRDRQERLSKVMDVVNSGGNSLLRLASQRSGHYADGIRSEYRSRLYSTSLDDIIEVY